MPAPEATAAGHASESGSLESSQDPSRLRAAQAALPGRPVRRPDAPLESHQPQNPNPAQEPEQDSGMSTNAPMVLQTEPSPSVAMALPVQPPVPLQKTEQDSRPSLNTSAVSQTETIPRVAMAPPTPPAVPSQLMINDY